jgi:glycine hydroxymethyltransferase
MLDQLNNNSGFFTDTLAETDAELFASIASELGRQRDEIELIASENIVSAAVMEAQGSAMTNKYAEGYPGRRYYGGCQYVDVAENLAIERACKLFNCEFANVQPNSGSQANQGVFTALVNPGDTILGMSLDAGGHLTHGAKPNQSGKWFNAVQYGVRKQDNLIDYDQIAELAKEHKPKLIIAGGSAIPRILDFAKIRSIADSVGAYVLADVAHFAGLIAAKAVAFGEALKPDFKQYIKQVIKNAQALSDELIKGGLDTITHGTDTHVLLVDLRPKGVKGNATEKALERAHITCNKNGVPFDPEKPAVTSGIRLGSPAGTTRGFEEDDFRQIGRWIIEVVDNLAANGEDGNNSIEEKVKAEVAVLCAKYPLYPNL